MPGTNWQHNGRGDHVDGEDGNWATSTGAWPKVVREMETDATELDGEPYGNRARLAVERGPDGPAAREMIRMYYLEVGRRYLATGEIRDLEVEVDDVVGTDGPGVRVGFLDVLAGKAYTTTLKPWRA